MRNGDRANYTVSAANDSGSPCDLTNATVTLVLPAADGTPTGRVVTLASNTPTLGQAPLAVTYDYVLTNDSSTHAPLSGVVLTDDKCAPVLFTGGVEGALVRVTGPGFVKRLTTDAKGDASVRIRSKRTGTLVIQSDRCLGADRVAVLGQRLSSSPKVPRVTG